MEINLKTVFVYGSFNVVHPGHLRLLRFAKECGDHLIVAVQSDRIAGNAAHVPQALRLEGVESIGWVDEAFIFDEPLTDLISRLKRADRLAPLDKFNSADDHQKAVSNAQHWGLVPKKSQDSVLAASRRYFNWLEKQNS